MLTKLTHNIHSKKIRRLIIKNLLKEIDDCQKKINELRPIDDFTLTQLKDYFRIGLTYSSNALEGNSLTESETKIIIEDGLTIGGKPLRDHFEAIGHSEAYTRLFELAKTQTITQQDIRYLHQLFYQRIDQQNAGAYRTVKVFLSGSKYNLPNPNDIPQLMDQLIQNCELYQKKLHPVEFSAKLHKDFVFIHPFIDGNGHVARLLMNMVLVANGYCLAIIPPILRSEYINALESAHINDQDFIKFIARMVKETQKDYLRLLQ